jgi:hypothetical protein
LSPFGYNTGLRIRPLCIGVEYYPIPDVPEGVPEFTDSLLDPLPPSVKHAITWLHIWAKIGLIPIHIAEHTLNTHLAVPSLVEENELFEKKPWLGIMYASDTPCLANIPDLWGIMRDTLKYMQTPRKKNIPRNMLHVLFMQALPCFHQTNKHYVVDEHVTVALNILMALVFGLYKNVNRKPHFMIRVALFKKIHILMTSTLEKQQEFFVKHPCLIMLAFMEYIAQITPMFWPAEYEFLLKENNLHFFFEKIPLICDEFRILDINKLGWDELEKSADLKIHKCSRARRINKSNHLIVKKKKIPCDVSVFLDCPVLLGGQNHELILLAHAFQIPLHILQNGHSLIQVHDLPGNIKKIQHEKMIECYSCIRTRFICSRLFICVQCAYNKRSIHNKFRLSMQTEQLVCSECLGSNVVSVDVMGRCVVIHNTTYILCPQCCKVHVYNGENTNWISTCSLNTTPAIVVPRTYKCDVCEDTNCYSVPQQRVNHLTGEMEYISFCYKHYPNEHVLKQCVNMHQMKQLQIRRSSWMRKDTKKIYNY